MDKGEVGDVYVDYRSFSDTNAFRLQTREYKLERIEAYVNGTVVYIGNIAHQPYPIASTKSIILHNIDLADLWFKGDGNAELLYVIGTTK